MSTTTPSAGQDLQDRPVVLRGGTVLTMDDQKRVLRDADVLVVDQQIAAVGASVDVPPDAVEIDASRGIVMPGMIDTHRHMWQTAMRGYGADWTLTQYFVWYYLSYGKVFRPEDIYAGNLLSAIESLDAGVTTTVDWSHGLQTVDHAEAAVDALEAVPGRFVLAYGNIQAGPWEWSTKPEFRDFVSRRITSGNDMLGFQMAFDVTGDPEFPERAAFEVARELGAPVTTHAGVWGATSDDGVRLMHENGFATPGTIYVHATSLGSDSYQRIAATGGTVSVATESEQSCGQGYPPSWVLRTHDIPVSLSMDTSVWMSGDLFSVMRSTLVPTALASTSRHTPRVRRSPTTTCVPSRSWSGQPAAVRRRSGSTASSGASRWARRPTSSCSRTTTRRPCSRCSIPMGRSCSKPSGPTFTP